MEISRVTPNDIDELVVLINSAYRGDASRAGWTTEADFLEGDLRTDAESLRLILDREDSMMLKHVSPDHTITGCVLLRVEERGLYLGMLSVSPGSQDGGIGKKLMAASETLAASKGCRSIFMNVISLRKELIAWYERRGYVLTGETKPMPTDHRFGKPTQPLEFAIMEKMI